MSAKSFFSSDIGHQVIAGLIVAGIVYYFSKRGGEAITEKWTDLRNAVSNYADDAIESGKSTLSETATLAQFIAAYGPVVGPSAYEKSVQERERFTESWWNLMKNISAAASNQTAITNRERI